MNSTLHGRRPNVPSLTKLQVAADCADLGAAIPRQCLYDSKGKKIATVWSDDGLADALAAAFNALQPTPPHPIKSTTHEERFFHFRYNPMYFRHVYAGLVPQGGTVFLRKDNDGAWYGALSLCSVSDQFCRAAGRQSARRKYFLYPKARERYTGESLTPADLFEWAKCIYEDNTMDYVMRRYKERRAREPVAGGTHQHHGR
jgi:hypothetical protein